MGFPWPSPSPNHGENLFSLPSRQRRKVYLYVLLAAFSVPLGYLVVSLSMNTYSFLSLYRPEELFQETDRPSAPMEAKGSEILEALNQEIEKEGYVEKREESWLLARVDRLWHSVRRYVSPSGGTQSGTRDDSPPPLENTDPLSYPFPSRIKPSESSEIEKTPQDLKNLLSLSADPEVLESVSQDGLSSQSAARGTNQNLLKLSSASTGSTQEGHGQRTAEWLYRFEPIKGVRTQSLSYQLSRHLALEGTVEAQPMGDTDTDLSDFGFRTVHALNLLRDRPMPATVMGYEGVHSGYPLSYGIGVNYQVSPLVNLRFDYSYETPHDYLVEYNGSWESSLMTNYHKSPTEDSLSIHSFFFGFRYLCRQNATRIPLHTGFFYSTNMEDEPLDSNVSMGFSIGGGINRRDLHLGFAWRFRVWDNPEPQFLEQQEMQDLETRVSNQFLFTLQF
jgi:hypothetical protein